MRGEASDFSVLEDARAEGQTDYLALIHRFAADGAIGEMDCVYSSWTTRCGRTASPTQTSLR